MLAHPELLLLLPLPGRIFDAADDDDSRCMLVRAIGPPTSMGDSDFGGGVQAPFSDV